MKSGLKIAIIGDYNFTYNTHHATNIALDHARELLEIDLSYYWIRIHEAADARSNKFSAYDAVIFAPGPFENVFFISGVLNRIMELNIPVLITGEVYKTFIELLINQHNLNADGEKLISDNLISSEGFEKTIVIPQSKNLKKLYNELNRTELTTARYSIYPQLTSYLVEEVIDVEAVNQFDDLEIISLKKHPFCVASMSLIQICSTRDMPHPLITGFLSYLSETVNKEI